MLVSAGPVTHQLWQVPHSQSWSPVDWAEERAPGEGPAAGMSDSDEEDEDGPREKIPDAMNVVEFPANNSEDFKVEDAEVKTEVKEEGSVGEGDVPGALVPHSRSSGALRGGMSQVERLRQCVATERARLTFGKSGIHGWGLFAKKDMKAGSMVIEYRGETMRPSIAERREADYHKEGKDCYLFTVNENHVIDSTMRGTIGRFTNHSCQPSMYTRTIDIDNEPHLIFYTRTEVAAGQELTYDYRFKEESGDNKMSCGCGAPNCRGTMN